MPTYEYVCNDCGHQFEAFQKMSEEPIDTCPLCSGKVERLIGLGSGIIFKDSGFYTTDHRKNPMFTECSKESPCCGRETLCTAIPCED